jgi:putative membrane protein
MEPAPRHGTIWPVTGEQVPPPSDPPPTREAAIRDHLANERTLLAWQRTALAMIGIGFLVDRFALDPSGSSVGASALGVLLILAGAAIAVVGAYRFVRTEREIDTGSYRPAILAHLVLAVTITVAAIAMAVFVIVAPA